MNSSISSKLFRTALAASLAIALGHNVNASAENKASSLPNYQPSQLKSTQLTSVGSETMSGLVEKWVEAYKAFQPSVTIQVEGRGSAFAPPALIEGTANFGHMVRPMKEAEVEDFRSKYGFEPTQIRTAMAGVAVYVHKDNPLTSISFDELERIYSQSPKRTQLSRVQNWAELGVKGQLAAKPLVVLGSIDDSNAYTFFRQQVMLQNDFASSVLPTSDSKSLFESIRMNPAAIGYGDFANPPADVKILKVSKVESGEALLPNRETIASGAYPLGRYLSLYIVRNPDKQLDPSSADFLRFVLSKEGQEIVAEQGLIPLSARVVQEERQKI